VLLDSVAGRVLDALVDWVQKTPIYCYVY